MKRLLLSGTPVKSSKTGCPLLYYQPVWGQALPPPVNPKSPNQFQGGTRLLTTKVLQGATGALYQWPLEVKTWIIRPALPDYVLGYSHSSGTKIYQLISDFRHLSPSLCDPSPTHGGLHHVLQGTHSLYPQLSFIFPTVLSQPVNVSLMWVWGAQQQMTSAKRTKSYGQLMARPCHL